MHYKFLEKIIKGKQINDGRDTIRCREFIRGSGGSRYGKYIGNRRRDSRWEAYPSSKANSENH